MSLSRDDALRIIAASFSDDTILVGGQAVAFWSAYFGIPTSVAYLTYDVDFVGTAAQARRAHQAMPFRSALKIAQLGDATPNSAVISVTIAGEAEPIVIDYLTQIVGVDTRELKNKAQLIEFGGVRMNVIHPLQLLVAKISNLYRLPRKRNAEGIEQARLAILILRTYLERQIEDADFDSRSMLNLLEDLGRFAATVAAITVRLTWNLSVLDAVPEKLASSAVLPTEFHIRRWPQIHARIERLTSKIRSRMIGSTQGRVS